MYTLLELYLAQLHPEMHGWTWVEARKRIQVPATLDCKKREALICLSIKHVLKKPFHLFDLFNMVNEIQQHVPHALIEKA